MQNEFCGRWEIMKCVQHRVITKQVKEGDRK